MKLLFKQRRITFKDSYDVYDENRKVLYTIKGHSSLGNSLSVYQDGKEIAKLKEKIIALLPRYDMYIDDKFKGYIRKEVTLYHPRFSVTYSRWKVRGNFFEYSYQISDPANRTIANIYKDQSKISDTYIIDVIDEKDALASILIVLAIDVERSQREASRMTPHYKTNKRKNNHS